MIELWSSFDKVCSQIIYKRIGSLTSLCDLKVRTWDCCYRSANADMKLLGWEFRVQNKLDLLGVNSSFQIRHASSSAINGVVVFFEFAHVTGLGAEFPSFVFWVPWALGCCLLRPSHGVDGGTWSRLRNLSTTKSNKFLTYEINMFEYELSYLSLNSH